MISLTNHDSQKNVLVKKKQVVLPHRVPSPVAGQTRQPDLRKASRICAISYFKPGGQWGNVASPLKKADFIIQTLD